MKISVKPVMVLGMIFLNGILFGQAIQTSSENTNPSKEPETSLHLILNAVSTNLNYGKSNNVLSDYKKPILGPQVGLSFQAGITSRFSWVSELYFIMKGGKLKANNPLTAQSTTLRLYTIESPLLARFHFKKFYLNAGPSITFNLAGTMKVAESSTQLSFTNTDGRFKRFEGGIQGGAGYMFRLKQKRLVLDIRYVYGLTNISFDQEMYNRYLNINLHFLKPWKTNPMAKKKES